MNRSNIFIVIIALIIFQIFIITKISTQNSSEFLFQTTQENALNIVNQYKVLRSYYTENIVNKIQSQTNLHVDSQHINVKNTIPLPATMIHDLSNIISKKYKGITLKLYSDYPFKNRISRSIDAFEKEALRRFRTDPKVDIYAIKDMINGKNVMRVTIPDKMTSNTCVSCHNSRLDSPKRDWKLNDVRGVLEVILPIESHLETFADLSYHINFTVIATGVLVLLIILLLINYYTKIEEKHKDKLAEHVKEFGDYVIASHTDLNGIITYASKALCRISGYSEEELIGQPHNILRHPDMSSEVFKDLWHTIQNEKVWNGEIKNRTKSSKFYWVDTTIFPYYNDKGKHTGYRSIRQDITPLKSQDEFFSKMSHELRTPLNSINGFTNILEKELTDEKHLKYLKYIGTSSQQLLGIISDILDLAKARQGEFHIEAHEFNLRNELNTFEHKFDGLLASKGLVFKLEIDETIEGLYLGDWLRINQILSNLISNSIKFTPESGTISLKAFYSDSKLYFEVHDTGIGISDEVKEKVFMPFVQADCSTTRKYGGTGLGLAISQQLIEMMHGTLRVESQEGNGSTFFVDILLEQIASESQKKETVQEPQEKQKFNTHILVAEDNKTNQILISLILEGFGISCDIANDGQEAVQMYDPEKHSLILMDENMPNLNGIGAMKQIRKIHKEACGPIIALTANVMEGDKEHFINEGMDDYVGKPIEEEQLALALSKALKGS